MGRNKPPQLRPSDIGLSAPEHNSRRAGLVQRARRPARRIGRLPRFTTGLGVTALAVTGIFGYSNRDGLNTLCLRKGGESVAEFCGSQNFLWDRLLSPPSEPLLPSIQFKIKRVLPAGKNEKGESVAASVFETPEYVKKLGVYSIDGALITKDPQTRNILVKADFQYDPTGYREAYTEFKDVPGFTKPISNEEILQQTIISFANFMTNPELPKTNPELAKTWQSACITDMSMLVQTAITHSGYYTKNNPFGVAAADLAKAQNGYELGAYASLRGNKNPEADDPSLPNVYIYGQVASGNTQKSYRITCGAE